MRNLIVLRETRHTVPVPASSSAGASDPNDDGKSPRAFVSSGYEPCCIAHDPSASNPSSSHRLDYDDDHDQNSPSTFVLTPNGLLLAASSNHGDKYDSMTRPTTTKEDLLTTTDGVLWMCDLAGTTEGDYKDWFHVSYVDDAGDADSGLVCLSHSGAVVIVSTQTGEAEVVGDFDHGLLAGQWSPDGEILALIVVTPVTPTTSEEDIYIATLVTMNSQFEILAETEIEGSRVTAALQSEATTTSTSITWRPDGTAVAVMYPHADEPNAAVAARIKIFSREDAKLLAVGRSEDGSGKTVPGLQPISSISWASHDCSNLLTAVQRKGKKATSPQQVVFFESNGLRHGEFKMRPMDGIETVTNLEWNLDGTLLAVTLQCSKPDSDIDSGKIQLWHRSNYHWYLKHEIRYSMGTTVSFIQFDNERPYHLCVALTNTNKRSDISDETFDSVIEWRDYEFCWDSSTISYDASSKCSSALAVGIDGNILNMTPLDRSMVPPPMYASSLKLDLPISSVAFISNLKRQEDSHPISMVVSLSDSSLVLVGQQKNGENSGMIANFTAPGQLSRISEWEGELSHLSTSLRQLLVTECTESSGSGMLVLKAIAVSCSLAPNPHNNTCDHIVEIRIEWSASDQKARCSITNAIKLSGQVLRMTNWADSHEGALIELTDGTLLEYVPSDSDGYDGSILPSDTEPLMEPCPWIVALFNGSSTFIEDHHDHHHERLVVGLSERSRLYCSERLLTDAASSFILSPRHQFLSYVTLSSRSQLRFLPLSELKSFDPLMGSDENHMLEGYEPRNVERGSRLVCILPNSPTAIVQLPRGNIEGVYPRALVLPFAMSKIKDGNYAVAFDIMRRQKVDFNLIVDMDPAHFMSEGVVNLIDQVKKIDHLNLFISSLFDGDITQWKYRVPTWLLQQTISSPTEEDDYEIATERAKFDFTTKVNQVCTRMRDVMQQAESNDTVLDGHFLLPILSTMAKERPPQLEQALALIEENAVTRYQPGDKKSPLLSDRAQSSIQYLAFLADYELLFDTALGLYNFDLAKAVARNSQMDPKVYLPLLKRLRGLPESVARYEVDLRLNRYESALKNLVRSSETIDETSTNDDSAESLASRMEKHFQKCLEFTEQHKLYKLALQLFESQTDQRRRIMISLGEHLLQEKNGEAALSVFLAVDPCHIDGARRASRMCGDWKTYFACCLEKEDEVIIMDQKRELAATIAEEISSGGVGVQSKREGMNAAARILLDYCDDIAGAVDMFINGEMWSEGRRVAQLHSRDDLVKRCVDAAVSYGQTCIGDFEDRATAFKDANERYAAVVTIRREALQNGEGGAGGIGGQGDDNASVFSAASNTSNTSLRSNMSGSSIGSVTSVSSVISAGAVSTFSMTGEHDLSRHNSKFSTGPGKKKKKKKSKKRGPAARRMKPGSEEELKSLVMTLETNILDDEYCGIIAETIQFLAQAGKLSLAHTLYEAYNDLKTVVEMSQSKRVETGAKEKEQVERASRKEGIIYEHITLECEERVDALRCKEMPDALNKFFSFL